MQSEVKQKVSREQLKPIKNVQLYKEKCLKDGTQTVSFSTYKHILNTEYNLGFHKPKKNECTVCFKYRHSSADEKQNQQNDYDKHIERKNKSRTNKATDKLRCQTDPNVIVITFDLEKVLPCPYTNAGIVYYKRKLAMYNLTVYELESHKAICYMWHEGEGGRGSNNMATCIYKYLESLPPNISHVIMYSDTCGGQNRNQNFAVMCCVATQKLPIETIDHKFFESGHSQMECDSVHSAIDTAGKRVMEVYAPSDWIMIAKSARKKDPYQVIELTHSDFLDYKKLAKEVIRNRTQNEVNETANWLHMKWLRFEKKLPLQLQYWYNLDAATGNTVNLRGKSTTRRRGNAPLVVDLQTIEVSRQYQAPLKIAKAKLDDLLSLCGDVIRGAAVPFYKSLHGSVNVRDCLAEPNFDEESEEEG